MEMLVVGQRAHMQWCYDFVQFETFGVMDFNQACEYCDTGHLKIHEVRVMPLTHPLTVIELTASGRLLSRKLHKLWNTIYAPAFKADDPNWILEDLYTARQSEQMKLALSQKRFDDEIQESRLSGIIAKCPAIVLLNV